MGRKRRTDTLPSCFNLFSRDYFETVRAMNRNATANEINAIIGNMWRSQTEETRAQYKLKAQAIWRQHGQVTRLKGKNANLDDLFPKHITSQNLRTIERQQKRKSSNPQKLQCATTTVLSTSQTHGVTLAPSVSTSVPINTNSTIQTATPANPPVYIDMSNPPRPIAPKLMVDQQTQTPCDNERAAFTLNVPEVKSKPTNTVQYVLLPVEKNPTDVKLLQTMVNVLLHSLELCDGCGHKNTDFVAAVRRMKEQRLILPRGKVPRLAKCQNFPYLRKVRKLVKKRRSHAQPVVDTSDESGEDIASWDPAARSRGATHTQVTHTQAGDSNTPDESAMDYDEIAREVETILYGNTDSVQSNACEPKAPVTVSAHSSASRKRSIDQCTSSAADTSITAHKTVAQGDTSCPPPPMKRAKPSDDTPLACVQAEFHQQPTDSNNSWSPITFTMPPANSALADLLAEFEQMTEASETEGSETECEEEVEDTEWFGNGPVRATEHETTDTDSDFEFPSFDIDNLYVV